MDPALAWNYACVHLKTEMPRSSFDEHLRDTRFLSFEDNLLTIGCVNAFNADWLTSRLASTVSRLLIGYLNQNVEVQFIVTDFPDLDDLREDEPEDEKPDGTNAVTIVDTTRYQNEVHPDRVVVIPGYTLRLMEQGDVTPKQLSLWIGFRQAAMAWKNRKPVVSKIRNQEVIKFAMMSRAAFFREIEGQDQIAGGLVERIPSQEIRTSNEKGRWYQNANTYRVFSNPFLGSVDAACIEELLRNVVSLCATHAEAAKEVLVRLGDLEKSDPAEWLYDPGKHSKARHTLQIVRNVLELKGDIPFELAEAAERLQDRLLAAYGHVVISHYFLQKLAPHLQLTHAQAWAIITLRDRCWYDYETRIQRDFAIVHGGVKTLASWVNSSEKSVRRWINDPRFTCLVDTINVPDMPDYWKLDNTLVLRVRPLELLVSELNGQSDTSVTDKVILEPGQSETPSGQSDTSVPDNARLESGQSATPLNNLIKPLFKTSKTPELNKTTGLSDPPDEVLEKHLVAVGNLESWDATILLNNLRASPILRAKLIRTPAWQIVSWLLYACSPNGSGINNPVNYALAMVANKRCGAGGSYDHFAQESPPELVRKIYQSPRNILEERNSSSPDWDFAMGKSNSRIRMLLPFLTGVG
jgi:hypothetical protein